MKLLYLNLIKLTVILAEFLSINRCFRMSDNNFRGKVIPMIFNREMINALVDNRKSVTRRPVPEWQLPSLSKSEPLKYISIAQRDRRYGFAFTGDTPEEVMNQFNDGFKLSPFGNRGDLIWVRETFQLHADSGSEPTAIDIKTGQGIKVSYPATDRSIEPESMVNGTSSLKKRPSLHMPRWASRLTLEITNARVERIQSITKDQARQEGVSPMMCSKGFWEKSFQMLWDGIYENWNDNPWVWVIEFEVIHQNIDDYLKSKTN